MEKEWNLLALIVFLCKHFKLRGRFICHFAGKIKSILLLRYLHNPQAEHVPALPLAKWGNEDLRVKQAPDDLLRLFQSKHI